MSKKVYKTAQGKNLDLGSLQLQNEGIRAVGNMGVNANGDKINVHNDTIDSRAQRVSKQYKKQIKRNNVVDDVVHVSKASSQKEKIESPEVEELVFDQPVIEESVTEPAVAEAPTEQPAKSADKPIGGLAGAIAKAKSVKQEPMKTPRQQAQEKSGVKKI